MASHRANVKRIVSDAVLARHRLHVDRPDLRIVSDEAWKAAHARLRGIRARLETAQGTRPGVRRDIDSKYLLSGFARCGTCGGTLSALSRSHGKKRAFFYGCLAHAKRGATVCDNALVKPVGRVDDAVLAELKFVLRPAVVRAIIDGVFEALKPTTVTNTLARSRTSCACSTERSRTSLPLSRTARRSRPSSRSCRHGRKNAMR
jgi:hypothetical protein